MIEGGKVLSGNWCCDSGPCGCCLPTVTGLGASATAATDKGDIIYKFFEEGAEFTCQEFNSSPSSGSWSRPIKDGNFAWNEMRIELQFWKDAGGGYLVDAWGSKVTELNLETGSFRLQQATASTLNGKFTRLGWKGLTSQEVMAR